MGLRETFSLAQIRLLSAKVLILILACFMLSSPALAFTGAYIQFDEDSRSAEEASWRKLIADLHAKGFRHFVIRCCQHEHYKDRNQIEIVEENFGAQGTELDLIETILKAADELSDVKVSIGLPFSDFWWNEEQALFNSGASYELQQDKLRQAIKAFDNLRTSGKSMELLHSQREAIANCEEQVRSQQKLFDTARLRFSVMPSQGGGAAWIETSRQAIGKLESKYSHHPSFSGYYIPQEIPDRKHSREAIAAMRAAFQQIAATAHQENASRDVLVTPFYTSSQAVTGNYAKEFVELETQLNDLQSKP